MTIPKTVLGRFKEMRRLSEADVNCIDWYNTFYGADPKKAWGKLCDEVIAEIEMHQRLNGELYKKLYPE